MPLLRFLTDFDVSRCMKDGMIVESGSHEDLMSAAGEYAKLYKTQAQAFISDGCSCSTYVRM
jgi:ABC-type multidrug transport system fused ATPase/permease subunit